MVGFESEAADFSGSTAGESSAVDCEIVENVELADGESDGAA